MTQALVLTLTQNTFAHLDLQGVVFFEIPPVLNYPVCSLCDKLDKTGLVPVSEELSLLGLFALRLGYTEQTFWATLIQWMGLHCSEVPMIEKWLVVRGLTLADYISHLWEGGTSDSLELWMASLATNTLINIFMEDKAFSMAVTWLDLGQPSLVVTSFHSGVWCREGEEEASAVALPPSPITLRKVGRHLCVQEQDISSSSSGIDTDPDELFKVDSGVKPLSMPSGCPRPRMCPVCKDMLRSGLALDCHWSLLHPFSCCFSCTDCEATFNNLCQVSSHTANVHRRCKVSCKQCDYTTVSRAKMRQHV